MEKNIHRLGNGNWLMELERTFPFYVIWLLFHLAAIFSEKYSSMLAWLK